MIIVISPQATELELQSVLKWIAEHGYAAHLSRGEERTIVGVIGDERPLDREQVERLPGVEKCVPILAPYRLASLELQPAPTHVPLNGLEVGAERVALIAGPCSVESRSQILEAAHAVREAGATALRGGAFKPRTSPYSFQGLGLAGLELLAEAREATGLPVVTEVMAPEQVSLVSQYADVLQIGARNMQNYNLLNAVGQSRTPVLLKRGMMNTMEELLMSAEYILSHGNSQVMLCERGIRTFEPYTRNTFDVNAIPSLKQRTHLPVIADPSHATGHWELVGPAARAAVAAGADGLIIEVHPDPAQAESDGLQSLKPERFADLVPRLRAIAEAVGRTL
ncbi:MAG: 3-deoxy-7-phosphoheptulonate synthase [Candidatus Promineifilaceae bacterium]|nr:3-deoxy-7-phosphoheptulonate synthase [Candidatus Promineifilaceae bacterium]